MRSLLIVISILLVLSADLIGQTDFLTLDRETYDLYLKGDYKNLKNVGEIMILQGMDYYYLRMRMGILAYNNERYPEAFKHFSKAISFNSGDTISREYIYYSYLFSGRKADANLYLDLIPRDNKNSALKSLKNPGFSDFFVGTAVSGFDVMLYTINNLYYEAVKNNRIINAGLDTYFSSKLKATFLYTNFLKTGTQYSEDNPTGTSLDLTQNQLYVKISSYVFSGWEFLGFGHGAIYSDINTDYRQGFGMSSVKLMKSEFSGGVGISKNGWKIRGGTNISVSNFSYSQQFRGEGFLSWLPFGNLNLYLTSGGMFQSDKNWGTSYQLNQEVGFKIAKWLWMETGFGKGNSFLYTRYEGSLMNNSFLIPATSAYSNIIVLPGNRFSITLTPFYARNEIYSWDLSNYTRTDKQIINSFGGSLKLIYKK